MDINFGSDVTNCAVVFDSRGNYGIANNSMWIHGASWYAGAGNGNIAFPNGIKRARLEGSPYFSRAKIKIPSSVTNMDRCFYNAQAFNFNLIIPNSVTTMDYCFYNARVFNTNIIIPDSVVNLRAAFSNCRALNQNIKISNSAKELDNTFLNCYMLNQDIHIPYGVNRMSSAFAFCSNFNGNVSIPNSVTYAYAAFNECVNLNQNIQIPNTAINIAGMFSRCLRLNQNIRIPSRVTNAWCIFRHANNISNVTIEPGMPNGIVTGMFTNSSNNRVRNIWTDQQTATNLLTTKLIHDGGYLYNEANCILPTWETITNGYYNSLYSVYIYTNAVFN